MLYIFRDQPSMSAKLLAEAVDGIRLRRPENLLRRARATDKVVMWGTCVPAIRGLVLNNIPLQNKYEDAMKLKAAGIRTIEVGKTRPAPVATVAPPDPLLPIWDDAQDAAEAFTQLVLTRNPVAQTGVKELIDKLGKVKAGMLTAAPVAPPQTVGEWLGRKYHHVGGNDLLTPKTTPDFYVKKETFVNEYRVHSFLGKSIRAGKKIPRTPQGETPFTGTPHPWVRSFNAGWWLTYDDEALGDNKQQKRDLAHKAVKTLGLNFGAVDIGETGRGELIVLEINRAPGVENGTVEAYARSIRKWASGEWTA